jgi:hypothetical protein
MAPRTASTSRHVGQSGGPGGSSIELTSPLDIRSISRSSLRWLEDMKSVAAPLSTRSVIMSRSTISNGAIAGAVVGSVVGFLLILLCLSPFIRKALRDRAWKKAHAKGEGSDTPPGSDERRLSASHFHHTPGATSRPGEFELDGKKPSWPATLDGSATGQPWKQEIDNFPAKPADVAEQEQELKAAEAALAEERQPIESKSPVPEEIPLPSPQEDETALQSSTSRDSHNHHHHHIHHIHLPHVLQHVAEAVRKQTDPEFAAPSRSVTWDQTEEVSLTPDQFAHVIFNPAWTDDPNGEAYSYYHDPDLLSESPTSEQGAFTTQPPGKTTSPTGSAAKRGSGPLPAGAAAAVPRTSFPQPGPAQARPAAQIPQAATPQAITPLPDSKPVSPTDDSTVSPSTPTLFNPALAQIGAPRGRLQELRNGSLDSQLGARGPKRMDTLPLTGITADSPVTTENIPNIPAPSINPMDIMPASNPAEQTHRVQHELDYIHHSPPQHQQQVFEAHVMHPVDDAALIVGADGLPGDGLDFDVSDYYESDQGMDGVDISDYSTPPPFSPPSNGAASFENTPATRISDAPSPASPHMMEHGQPLVVGHGGQHEAFLSPHPVPESPQVFKCDICDRTFDLYHKLK